MAFLLKTAIEEINKLDEYGDERAANFFLISNPILGIIPIITVYNIIVRKLGPELMKNYPAFNLNKILIIYNVFQVLACVYILYLGIGVWVPSIKCKNVDYSNTYVPLQQLKIWKLYFWLKITDLLDTVFFVLRKKLNQATFLHVYHHSGMVLLTWIVTKYYGGGTTLYIPIVNSFVHCVMYSYYLLSVYGALKPQLEAIKKYITLLQLMQFFLFFFMGSCLLIQNCNYPKYLLLAFLVQTLFMISLFGDFYVNTYILKKKTKEFRK